MTDKQKREENLNIMSFLKLHINHYVELSFTDLTFDLEKLILNFLNIFEKENCKWRNANAGKFNYPAIDLINDSQNIVIQVTTNANTKKINKTIKVYESHKMTYDELIIIGFVKNSKTKKENVSVFGSEFLTNKIATATDNQQDEIYNLLTKRIPLNVLHPKSDELAFDVVFDVINRSAVRDSSSCEGNYDDMVNGLDEIKQIITTGKIAGKSIRAKSLVEYTSKVNNKLREIEFKISEILQICWQNKNERNSDFVYLNHKESEKIDSLKKEIIDKTNILAKELGIGKTIIGSNAFN